MNKPSMSTLLTLSACVLAILILSCCAQEPTTVDGNLNTNWYLEDTTRNCFQFLSLEDESNYEWLRVCHLPSGDKAQIHGGSYNRAGDLLLLHPDYTSCEDTLPQRYNWEVSGDSLVLESLTTLSIWVSVETLPRRGDLRSLSAQYGCFKHGEFFPTAIHNI